VRASSTEGVGTEIVIALPIDGNPIEPAAQEE